MAKLVKAVFVRDPDRSRTVLLQPGEEPEPRLAALVTNPDCWENGPPPTHAAETADTGSDDTSDDSKGSDDSEDKPKAAPAAKKTAAKKTAASHRSRGRDAADEGSSGN